MTIDSNNPFSGCQALLEHCDAQSLLALRGANKEMKNRVDKLANHLFSQQEAEVLAFKIEWCKVDKRYNETFKGFWGKFTTFAGCFSDYLPSITKLFRDIFPRVNTLLEQRKALLVETRRLHRILIKNKKEWARMEIMKLFGGKKAFEELPVLKIANKKDRNGLPYCVKADEMDSSIMRGQYDESHRFISCKCTIDNQLLVVMIRETHSHSWEVINLPKRYRVFSPYIAWDKPLSGILETPNNLWGIPCKWPTISFATLRQFIDHIANGNGRFYFDETSCEYRPHPCD